LTAYFVLPELTADLTMLSIQKCAEDSFNTAVQTQSALVGSIQTKFDAISLYIVDGMYNLVHRSFGEQVECNGRSVSASDPCTAL